MIKVIYYVKEKGLKLLEEKINKGSFPDHSLLLKTNINFDAPIKITWHYESDEELFTIICLAKKAKSDKSLYMPYCPHARQDRVKSEEDVFTLKYFADVINWLNFDSVKILDPHSPVAEALFDRLVIKSPKNIINNYISNNFLGEISLNKFSLFFPDEGCCKRMNGMFTSIPYTFGIKKRDWITGKIEGLEVIGDEKLIKNKTILIVDDICSRGGTFLHSAKKLKELGADKIYLYVTHCENTILVGELLDSGLIEKVFTTDSIFTENHEKVEVLKL